MTIFTNTVMNEGRRVILVLLGRLRQEQTVETIISVSKVRRPPTSYKGRAVALRGWKATAKVLTTLKLLFPKR